jgi:tRNA (guanine-N7-)-methyltransferase
MPHIKVAPFNTEIIDTIKSDIIVFRAIGGANSEIALVKFKDKELILDIIKKDKEYLIKPNKVTKGSDSNFLKELLNLFSDELNLDILHTNTNIKPYKREFKHSALKSIEEFFDFSSSYKKIKLEVGFGSGRHLLYRAKEERDTLFIGVEIHTPSISQLLNQISLEELDNIVVVNYDARLLCEMLKSNILDTIYVHFPVPWDKKPHRRVISLAFLKEATRVLKKGGVLELRTDSENYYRYALEVFSEPTKSSFVVEKNRELEVISKYEARWRRMDKNIYTLTFKALEESKDKNIEIDFRLNCRDKNISFPKESIVKDDFFVHFGKVYKMQSGFVVECSFGSFNRPEKKMIVYNGKSCYYLPTLPVKTLVNLKAHNLIKEVLNG